MDLIYADANLIDQGVLQDYSLDECFGDEDNTFEVKIQRYNPAMTGDNPIDQDFILYIEFTEYGGIVDRLESDTATGEITLIGRTWHGYLNSYVIEPPAGYMYRTFNGTADDILREMISMFSLGSLFVVDPPNGTTVINIHNFTVRYEPMYDCIIRMLKANYGKLKCYFKSGKVHLYTDMYGAYTNVNEFDASQVTFEIGKTYNNVNHLICLGKGDGADRAVLHLYTNEYGGIQPYKLVAEPLEDNEYILDDRYKVMTGLKEYAAVYDYPNADVITNYKILHTKPADWESAYYQKYFELGTDPDGKPTYNLIEQVFGTHFSQLWGEAPDDWKVNDGYQNYYYIENGEYVNVKELTDAQAIISWIPMDVAHGYTAPPTDWDLGYQTYFQYSAEEHGYISVPAETGEKPIQVGGQPEDWAASYSSYYTRMWNGVEWVYDAVQGVQREEYEMQTAEPTDWKTNFSAYYGFVSKGYLYDSKTETGILLPGYYDVKFLLDVGFLKKATNGKKGDKKVIYNYPKWKKNTFYTKKTYTDVPSFIKVVADHWSTGGVWQIIKTTAAPAFVNDGRYFYKDVSHTPPWNGGGYYWVLDDPHWEKIPTFVPDHYYYAVYDRLKILGEYGEKKLQELADTSMLNINLELDAQYDVNDVIGAYDDFAKEVDRYILRKIIKIKKDIVTIEYQVE